MAKLDDLIQQKQQRDEDWKAKKTAEREELGQLSDDAVMHVTSEPGAYLHYLDTQAINPRYSASNVMLAMAQNPEITYINSLEVWNRLGRSVNRDENGMKIRVSDTYVKDGREYHGYKIGRVFDVTQTHGQGRCSGAEPERQYTGNGRRPAPIAGQLPRSRGHQQHHVSGRRL